MIPDSPEGSLVFGGVDSAKYDGRIETVPIVTNPETGKKDRLLVPWTSLTVNTKHGRKAIPVELPTLLDTGTTVNVVPSGLSEIILDSLDLEMGQPADCDLADKGVTVTFEFDRSVRITMPLSDLIPPLSQHYPDGTPLCMNPFFSADETFPFAILGDPFLRAAYYVVDQENYQVGLAQAKLNATETNLVACSPGRVTDYAPKNKMPTRPRYSHPPKRPSGNGPSDGVPSGSGSGAESLRIGIALLAIVIASAIASGL